MSVFYTLVLFSSLAATGFGGSDGTIPVTISNNYTEEQCTDEGIRQTSSHEIQNPEHNRTILSGTWPDGKKWEIHRDVDVITVPPKFSKYACVKTYNKD